MAGDSQGAFEARSGQVLARVDAAAGGGPINVLALSGGGAGAAFGAGVLVGWSKQGTRPEFQIVTGVSAGALISPFAFLGPSWDRQLTEAFSGARREALLQRRWLGGALFGTSVYRGEPLARLVDSYVTDALVKSVAAEGAKGRVLLVATTDLDTEQTTVWNLTLIASRGGEPARRLFRNVLIAAASIPGAFPPVKISVEASGREFDELHVDGATTGSLFVAPEIAGFLPKPIAALRGANLYVIFDTQLGAAPMTGRIDTLAILKRGIDAGMRSGKLANLQFAADIAHRNHMHIRVTEIPSDYPFGGALDLSPPAMKALFQFAAGCAAAGQIWATPIEVLEESEQSEVVQSHLSPQCPAVESIRSRSTIETLNLHDSTSAAGDRKR